MIDSLGWIIAALIALGAWFLSWIKRPKVTEPEPAEIEKALKRERVTVVEVTEDEVADLFDKLDEDDPVGAITDAANEARGKP